MKKFLFALMGLVVAGNAFGDECAYAKSYTGKTQNTYDILAPHIIITFDTRKSDVKECAQTKLQEFLGRYQDILEIVLIGSASKSGSDDLNKELSSQRLNAVAKLLPTGIKVSTFNEGEANAYRFSTGGDNSPIDRSVTIILVQKHVSEICNDSKIQEIIAKFSDKTGELKTACANTNLNNGKIVQILIKLVQQEPEIQQVMPNIQVYKLYAELLTETEDIRRRVTVWRTAEGKFNTARLLSDSIAGVVLGTVGGVVTSNLIKKSQVKQGFEDIKCSIGGQSVASYGDEFSVGLVH